MTPRQEAWKASPLRQQLMDLRTEGRLSLSKAAARVGISPVVLGSYERADRVPAVPVLERILADYGFALVAAPIGTPASLVDAAAEAAEQLHAIATRLDRPALTVVAA